jgi:hypothetical protein
MASLGSQLATIFRLDAAATVELFPPGDYNRDGTVDAADYILWRKTLGQSVAYGFGADGDASGTIDDGDYTVWRAHFGQTAGSGAAADGSASGAVPEPTSGPMLLLGMLVILFSTPRDCVTISTFLGAHVCPHVRERKMAFFRQSSGIEVFSKAARHTSLVCAEAPLLSV